MKIHHSSDAHRRGLSKAAQNCVIYIYYLGQMQCFHTKISIPAVPLPHDLTSGIPVVNSVNVFLSAPENFK